MRLLTFMQMAETHKEIDFDTIQREMGIEEDDVESFIIDGKHLVLPLPFCLIMYYSVCTCQECIPSSEHFNIKMF